MHAPEAVAPAPPAVQPSSCASIGDALARWAEVRSGGPALVTIGAPPISYGRLRGALGSLSIQLASAGLGRQHRIGLLVPAGRSGGVLTLAVACHCTLVPLNPALTVAEVLEMARAAHLDGLIVGRGVGATALLDALPALVVLVARWQDDLPSLEVLAGQRPSAGPVQPAMPADVAVILRSSGTTGVPKLIPVTHGNLLAMAERVGAPHWFDLGPDDRSACTLPLHYAAGIKTTLIVPLLLGASVAFPPVGRALHLHEWFGALQPTFLSCSPATLQGMVENLRARAEPFEPGALRFLMCGAGYLPEPVRIAGERLLGRPVLEFYGLSEAGVMAANPVPPGHGKPGTVGRPWPGELRIVDPAGADAAAGQVGRVLVSGPTVMPGYLDDGGAIQPLAQGWLDTGDLGRLDAGGFLTIAGRTKEIINRGGEKVFPYEVEKALLEHPAVLEAAVFGVPHPRLGENVRAAVVARPGAALTGEALRRFLRAQLAGFKVPARIELVQQLPRGSTGKVLRGELAGRFAGAGKQPRTPPAELLEYELLAIWQRLLRTEAIGIEDDFVDRGGDSLAAEEMLLEVEALCGTPYPDSELSPLTIRHMAQVIIAGCATKSEILTTARTGTGPPLFFCHGDYGSRGLYAHRLAAGLPTGSAVHLLHCGAQRLERCGIEGIAAGYVDAVMQLAGAGPVVVGGYCNGGLAAWALARQLRDRGVAVLEVLLVETPSLNARGPLRWCAAAMRALSGGTPLTTRSALAQEAMRTVWRIVRKSSRVLARWRAPRGERAGGRGAAPRVPLPALERIERLWLRRMASFVPHALDVPVTCFVAERGEPFDTRPQRWARLAPQVRAVLTPGSHHTIVIGERPALARPMGDALERAAAAASPAARGRLHA
ncbi:AMP-binding protein [Ramlibacter sp.]|uniref:AMP-binding protein n=1 Tax=Ramlibacter sp. TaxID=1917967 RepID=UPI002C61CBF9|nr:AMP-binding protein [Ramlibacter sp.]HWI80383.1 AMP-binding protein [Ramlibacter sp.]